MLPGFEPRRIEAGEVTINASIAGSGAPLLLLHGYPQTHVMWHRVAPQLAERFTVVAADLRGYGDSSKPTGAADHSSYSKRTMAADMVAAMAALGHERFSVAGHDRGGRVAYRMALDHPAVVERLALLDIVPTKTVYDRLDRHVATAYFHWLMLIQPAPLPETLIGANPGFWLDTIFGAWISGAQCGDGGPFTPAAIAAYKRCFDAATIHASCEDYRAGASLDCAHDAADLASGHRIACPLLVLWGERGLVGRAYDVVAAWREYASDVRGHAVPGGHFLPEEAPAETLAALQDFFD
jgi:haloacetate dehalogenase